ncbi:hypothetical protein ALP09_104139 [Pseudomonas amygdali pv. lachrymans]|nr:hypothetical protein ALP09_104139 [Pseudomonas amygdali pv. lachrymans]
MPQASDNRQAAKGQRLDVLVMNGSRLFLFCTGNVARFFMAAKFDEHYRAAPVLF